LPAAGKRLLTFYKSYSSKFVDNIQKYLLRKSIVNLQLLYYIYMLVTYLYQNLFSIAAEYLLITPYLELIDQIGITLHIFAD